MKPTAAEAKLLALVLREVRNVLSTGEQLGIYVDPYADSSGLSSQRIEGAFRRARKPRRAR